MFSSFLALIYQPLSSSSWAAHWFGLTAPVTLTDPCLHATVTQHSKNTLMQNIGHLKKIADPVSVDWFIQQHQLFST